MHRSPTCPACHKPELEKLVSAAGFQLKGSGWYVTDFRNSGAKPAAKAAGAKTSAQRRTESGAGDEDPPGRPRASDKGKSGDAKADGKPAPPAATRPSSARRPAAAAGPDRHRREPRRALPAAPESTPASGRRRGAAMKRYLIAGLLVWVPLGITIWVVHCAA